MDASDVFQDGVIAFHKNVIDRKFKGESAIGTYLYSICRFIWLKKLQNNGMSLTDIDSIDHATYEDPEFRLLDNEKRQMVSALFDELGEPCQTILTLATTISPWLKSRCRPDLRMNRMSGTRNTNA